ncbi:MAG: NEW3 domain-containing protein [Bacteroidota bacterium]
MRIFSVVCLGLLLATASHPVFAQAGSMFNQRDDKYRLLGLKRAKEMYEVARRELDRQKELFRRGLISQSDLDRAEGSFADAEVNYQQSLLAVLFEQQYVTVARAVKYQGHDGQKRVRLLVANASGGSAELQKLVNIDDQLFRSLQPDVINNVYVSLENNEGAIISQPYESKIDVLHYGAPKELEFTLLQDVDAVTVSIIYGNGTQRTMKIFLQKDASANKVLVQSDQFSQEGELGKTARYDLTLELFSRTSNTFGLEVVNLPQQIGRVFRDPSSSAMIGQFRFTESVDTRKVSLEVSLPDRPTGEVPMDKSISFYVLVIPHDRIAALGNVDEKVWTQAEVEKLNVGYLRLELVPRGKGRLLVRASQLYQTIHQDGTVTMSVDVVNEGTRRLDNIEMKADAPLNWTKTIDPGVIPQLGVSGEQRVNLAFIPPKGIPPGRYEIRLQTSALSENEPVNAEDKTLTVEVQAGTNVLGTLLILFFILLLVGGVVVLGVKLSRR